MWYGVGAVARPWFWVKLQIRCRLQIWLFMSALDFFMYLSTYNLVYIYDMGPTTHTDAAYSIFGLFGKQLLLSFVGHVLDFVG